MLYRLEGNKETKSLFSDATSTAKKEHAMADFLSIEDFRSAAVTRLSALKAAYLQQLETSEQKDMK